MASADLQKFLDELRARISIVDVVGAKVKLVRKGREYQACCPFHNEKTPSFTVNEAKGFYHCFGCGAHGDIIKFEMEANNLPFMDAVHKLADKAGLRVPQDVKIVSFDSTLYSLLTDPPLTSIERNPQSIAQKSCELILQMMRGEPPAETEIYIPTNLVERASTDG